MNLVWGGQALSETDVFVVGGTYGAGKIVRYDGNDWVDQTLPNTSSLSNVMVLSPTEAYAVGKGPMWSFDCIMLELTSGSTWSTVTGTPAIGSLWGCSGLWAENSSDMFLLATDALTSKIYRGPKNGPWSEMTLPSFPNSMQLEEVWGSSVDDVYAVGYMTIGGDPVGGVLLHYDGNTNDEWISIPMNPVVIMLNAVSGSGPCDVVVGGRAFDNSVYKGITMHYDGSGWTAPELTEDVQNVTGIVQRAPNETLAAGSTDLPLNEGGFGSDDGSLGLFWGKPFGQYGYFRGLSAVPGSNRVFIFAEANGTHVLSASCN